MKDLPLHSPLGASGAYRWLPPPYGGGCLGSVEEAMGIYDDESEFAALGTAAHSLGALCLNGNIDAWEIMGHMVYEDTFYTESAPTPAEALLVDKNMADAVQVYLDHVRDTHSERDQGNSWVERRFHCSEIHPLFYGTADFTFADYLARTLHVWDYKHGIGIVVEVKRNPQCMYYGIGALTELDLWDQVDRVVLHVAQPRGFHWAGPVREWSISTDDLAAFRDDVLVPAMIEAEKPDGVLISGEHCRFCAARKHACSQTMEDMDALEVFIKQMKENDMTAAALTNDQVGWLLKMFEVAKIVAKAARETGYVRAEKGATIPGQKLVKARANRGWKNDAETEAMKLFKGKALTEPVLKSPAQIDELPKGSAFTAAYAYKPDKGHQLVPDSDSRSEDGPRTKAMFKPTGKPKKGAKK